MTLKKCVPKFKYPMLSECLRSSLSLTYVCQNMMGEWGWPEEAVEVKLPVTNNDILGYIVQRLRNVVDPPITEPSSSLFPHFILKACVLGKFCSGKTTCLSKIAEGMI